MHPITQKYLSGLEAAFLQYGFESVWKQFASLRRGANAEDLALLRQEYPDLPSSLASLLEYADGTHYWGAEDHQRMTFFCLGTDGNSFDYYLRSTAEMLESRRVAQHSYADYIRREYDGIHVDRRITRDSGAAKWLHFTNCNNGGGSSQLLIDFTPSGVGKPGQIVRFIDDPDRLEVIAPSFEAYLEMGIKSGYGFVQEYLYAED